MQVDDLDQIMQIEEEAFPTPWPLSAYRHELTQNDLSTYLALKLRPESQAEVHRGPQDAGRLRQTSNVKRQTSNVKCQTILAYGGFWLLVDEAHISTIATRQDWRGRGLGEMMLVALLDVAILRGAAEATLEVRVSNAVAQGLYRKYAFAVVGRRKKYYRDRNEDALIMTTPRLDHAGFLKRYAALKAALRCRLAGVSPGMVR
jgi:ribosomal-protein-alanine N-acetyltransferase